MRFKTHFKRNLSLFKRTGGYCDIRVKLEGWQCKSTAEFKRSELAVLLRVLEHHDLRVS